MVRVGRGWGGVGAGGGAPFSAKRPSFTHVKLIKLWPTAAVDRVKTYLVLR